MTSTFDRRTTGLFQHTRVAREANLPRPSGNVANSQLDRPVQRQINFQRLNANAADGP